MVTNFDRKRVATMANRIHEAHPTLKKSEYFKRAWDLYWFRQMLLNGIAHFRYWKVNKKLVNIELRHPSVLREARGTLLMDVIPEAKRPKGGPYRYPNFGTMSYYDLDKDDWRSFDVTRFDGIMRFIPKLRK